MKILKSNLLIILLLLLSVFTLYRLLRPGLFSMQDDMHVFRLQQFDQCLKDGQIPCRYIPDAGFGYGYPLFNYYSPLPYVIGEVFHLVGFSFIDGLKIVFIIIRLLTPIGMYLLARIFFKPKNAFLVAVIYMFAPYQAIDGYVRGAVAEGLALSLIPFSMYFVLKNSITPHKKLFIGAVISTTCLFLSHNLFALISFPLTVLLVIQSLFNRKTLLFKNIVSSCLPLITSLLLSSFFLIPALLEKNLVYVETMTQGYFYYVNHFATLSELFISRFWGYGASQWGPVDDMSLQIGIIQWLLPLICLVSLIFFKKVSKYSSAFIFFLFGLFFVFLTHNQSTFIWKIFPFLAYFQFPWRFLGFAIIFFSLASGYIVNLLKNARHQNIFIAIVVVATIILNYSYFKEDIWYPKLTDQQKLSGRNLIAAEGAGLKDYWPKSASQFPNSLAPSLPWTDNSLDQYAIKQYSKTSNQLNLSINVTSPKIILNLPLVYFPNWRLLVDQHPATFATDHDLGFIKVPLSQGDHQLNLRLYNTPIRTLANLISIISLVVLALYYVLA